MRYELTDHEWTAIRPMLPNKPRGVPRVNDRRVLNGIFWVLRSGAPWRNLPDNFGPRRYCLILLKNRSIKLRARYRYGLKQIGSLRFRFCGMFAHAPCWRANSLIQSASYPRSASSTVWGGKALRRTEHSRLLCASPG